MAEPSDISARDAKAFELAAESVKQLLTLATGVVGVTVAFGKDIVPHTGADAKRCLTGAWILLLISLLAGVMSLMSQAGQLGNAAKISKPSTYASNIRLFTTAQAFLFLAGTVALVVAAILSLYEGKS